jgi:hypothetical protein
VGGWDAGVCVRTVKVMEAQCCAVSCTPKILANKN